ncbi:autotransporter outer membrane beta-barrel domain-containing protein [Pontibacter sp. MBLB2868]|uniref:autotransporter outer membrane beta-barrel domain-containing protein n=1 Tax=Pontibacter sp. MBLB2868 TaxID=3451555 RepID=UPI003F753FDA
MNRLLLLIFLLLPTLLLAQENESHLIRAKVKQGSFLLGGTINATAYQVTDELSAPGQTLEGTKINALISAKNGYFIWHDFVAGLDMTLSHESVNVTPTDVKKKPERVTYMLLGPFARYYLDNGIFGELTLQAGLQNFTVGGHKYDLYQGTIGVGYAYFINEKFSIEPVLSFRYFQKTEDDRSYTTMGPILGVGIQAYIIRKKAHVIKWAL